ncbi:MAG: hypothetical protein R3352_00105 [Salinisphaeraceae bacterium]|nr:hypothetical protein [Salinisphaeraceae bacterium]
MSQTETVLEAHVAFELKQWRGKTLEKRIKEDIKAFWEWADDVRVDELSSAERVTDIAKRLVHDMPLPEDIAGIIGTIAKHLVNLPVNRETRVADVIDAELYEEGTELIIELRELREQAIRQGVNSPVYGTLVSEILYNGIRDYLTSDNAVTQKIPGVSSLLNKGAGAISKRIPDLENRLRSSVEKNLNRTIRQSEKFLLDMLTDERIRHISEELWEMIQHSHLSVADVISNDDIDEIVAFGMKVWLHLRETDYLVETIREGIEHFFDEYGEYSVAALLDSIGVNKKLLQTEALTSVPPVIAVLDESGFLEATIRRRLEPFYNSKEAAKLLS